MTSVLITVLGMSAKASLLIVLVLLIRALCRKRIAPGWIHGLWLLVLLRLAIPGLPSSSFSAFNVEAIAPNLASEVSEIELPWLVVSSAASSSSGWLEWAAWLWLSVVGVLLVRILVASLRFRWHLRDLAEIEDPAIRRIVGTAQATLGIRRPVAVVETEWVRSPAIHGLRSPRILLPPELIERISPEDLRFVLLHELAHLRRFDAAWHAVAVVLRALHWFNPLVHYAFRQLALDREIACDHLVLTHLEEEQGRPYGETLLRLVHPDTFKTWSHAIGLTETYPQLKRRLQMIRSMRQRRHNCFLTALLFVGLAVLGLTDALVAADPGAAGTPQALEVQATETLGAETLLSIELSEATVGAVVEEIEARFPQFVAEVEDECASVELNGGLTVQETPFLEVVATLVEQSGCDLEYLTFQRLVLGSKDQT